MTRPTPFGPITARIARVCSATTSCTASPAASCRAMSPRRRRFRWLTSGRLSALSRLATRSSRNSLPPCACASGKMAIYFLNLKSLGRASGSSAVSAAAYRAGERIRDERTGRTYDHSGRQDVMHKEIILPAEFAAHDMGWAHDRGNLWNTAEHAEVRKDARVAREYLV